MKGWKGGIRAAAAALLLTGVAGQVRALEAQPAANPSATGPNLSQNPNAFAVFDSYSAPHKSLQLDSSGRWGLRLDIDPPASRDQSMDMKDVSAGAFFRITPSMRIGGTVGLGDRQADTQKILPQDANAPRVHLETKFKF